MPSKHIQVRAKLKSICSITAFDDLLNRSTLSDVDKEMLRLHYIQDKDFRYIADKLGFSESNIKKRHKRATNILGTLF